jgi:hypothetical protein
MGLIVVLIGFMVGVIWKARSSADAASCLGHVRQITVAFRLYANDDQGRLPNPGACNTSWEASIQKYVSRPSIFRCPEDAEIGPVSGSSYDWRDTGDPRTTLAGRSINAVSRNLVLTMEALPGWHKARMVNVGHVDGSVEAMNDQLWIADLMRPVDQR